jgi:hypothetical protein
VLIEIAEGIHKSVGPRILTARRIRDLRDPNQLACLEVVAAQTAVEIVAAIDARESILRESRVGSRLRPAPMATQRIEAAP